MEEGELIGGQLGQGYYNRFEYDAAGRLVVVDRRWNDMGGSRRTYTYNDRGDVMEVRIEQECIVGPSEDGMNWTEKNSYVHDDNGNWTEQRVQVISAGSEPRLSRVTCTLTYW